MSTDNSEFISQFGDTFINPSNDRSTSNPSASLAGKEIIMLYFSAHWCPPCRAFTPKLISFYNKIQADDSNSVELVFCSLDKKATEYEEYTSDMPWLCMPFEAKESNTMATKYKANGIPHLVIVNGVTGEVITFDGTSEVGEDADGLKFPWYPKTLKEIWTPEIQILGVKTSGNKTVEYSSLKDKYLMLYFSAHWCPPCQEFTPILSEAYTKLKSERDDFELVFVSSDRDKSAFNDYFKEMTFCALPFEHRDTKADLSKKYEVQGIPKLIMLGPVTDGETGKRELINGSLNGVITNGDFSEFPFYPKNYGAVDELEDPNQNKVLIAFHEGGNDEEQQGVKEVVKEVAGKLGKSNEGMQFLWALSTKGMSTRVREFVNVKEVTSDPGRFRPKERVPALGNL
mmetsp:Transcript_51088/g.61492  ORF Transcript_51088/g.61492 Transcript_51088/m.61492 type:complete len:400 (+) Transcript_51088:125-1324(+)